VPLTSANNSSAPKTIRYYSQGNHKLYQHVRGGREVGQNTALYMASLGAAPSSSSVNVLAQNKPLIPHRGDARFTAGALHKTGNAAGLAT